MQSLSTGKIINLQDFTDLNYPEIFLKDKICMIWALVFH